MDEVFEISWENGHYNQRRIIGTIDSITHEALITAHNYFYKMFLLYMDEFDVMMYNTFFLLDSIVAGFDSIVRKERGYYQTLHF